MSVDPDARAAGVAEGRSTVAAVAAGGSLPTTKRGVFSTSKLDPEVGSGTGGGAALRLSAPASMSQGMLWSKGRLLL